MNPFNRKLNIKYNGTYKHDLWKWSQELKWNHKLNVGVDVRYGHGSNYPGSDEHDFAEDRNHKDSNISEWIL